MELRSNPAMLLRLKAPIRLAAAKEWAMKLQIQWINTYEEFKQWVQENDRFPYTKSLDETERKLGSWLSKQRNEKSAYNDISFSELEKATFRSIPLDQVPDSRSDALKNFKQNGRVMDLLAKNFTTSLQSQGSDLSIADWCAIIKDFADKTADEPHYPDVKVTTPEYGRDGVTANEKQLAIWLGKITIEDGRLFLRGIERSGLSREQIKTIKKIKDLGRLASERQEKNKATFELFWKQNDGRYPDRNSSLPSWPKKQYNDKTEYQLFNWMIREKEKNPTFFVNFPQTMTDESKKRSGKQLFARFMEANVKNFLGEAYANLILYNKGLSGGDFYMTDNRTLVSNKIKEELTDSETTQLQAAKTLFFYDAKCCYLNRCPRPEQAQRELKNIIESLYVIGVSKEQLKFEIVTIDYSCNAEKQEISFNLKIDGETLVSKEMTFGELLVGFSAESKDNIIYFLNHLSPFGQDIADLLITLRTINKTKLTIDRSLCKKTKDMIYVFLEKKFPNQSDLLKSIVYAERQLKVAKQSGKTSYRSFYGINITDPGN